MVDGPVRASGTTHAILLGLPEDGDVAKVACAAFAPRRLGPVLLHHGQGRLLEQPLPAVRHTSAQDHPDKLHGVGDGADQSAHGVAHEAAARHEAALISHPPLAVLDAVAVDADETAPRGDWHLAVEVAVQVAPGGGARVARRESVQLAVGHCPEGVVHAERLEQARAKAVLEVLAHDHLQDAAQHVHGVAVLVHRPGVVHERHLGQLLHEVLERAGLPLLHSLVQLLVGHLHVPLGLLAEVRRVADAGHVADQVPQADGAARLDRLLGALGQDARALEAGQVLLQGVLQASSSLVHERHERRDHVRLGHAV
mmetsp:Transcript_138/g.342  ORF Transcript_138/g.342 Transcript_138/m.342 type:complete len:312 (-) Transcript_138:310-1245(-)